MTELRRFGAQDIVLTSNLQLRLDGLPRSGEPEPNDGGAAVYFTRRKTTGVKHYAMATDQYDRVADNIRALAAVIESMRAIARHGGSQLLEQATSAFAALPPAPEQSRADKLRALAENAGTPGERAAALSALEKENNKSTTR